MRRTTATSAIAPPGQPNEIFLPPRRRIARVDGSRELGLEVFLDHGIDRHERLNFIPARGAALDMRPSETAFLLVEVVTEDRFEVVFDPLTVHSHLFLFLPCSASFNRFRA